MQFGKALSGAVKLKILQSIEGQGQERNGNPNNAFMGKVVILNESITRKQHNHAATAVTVIFKASTIVMK